ncbi:MAG: hypothetical protein H0V71_08030 [Chloroflexi bacterium]|nr:hypothetical protein [Chloroflexota bacterium]
MVPRLVVHPNECMVRAGLLVGLASGFGILGYGQVAAGIGIFAAVQVITVVAQAVQGARGKP